jgi:hypothetical protein
VQLKVRGRDKGKIVVPKMKVNLLFHIYSVSSFRYIMVVKVSDGSGEGWVSAFNEEAEKIIGCSADELDLLKSQVTAKLEQNIM